MTFIEVLKNRGNESEDDYKLDEKLSLLMNNIQSEVSESIKRILVTLNEFDLHDASHCEKVVKNMEELIGEDKLTELSSYELFFLQLSAYLHDSAMAPSEFELKLGELTEGTDAYHHENSLLKHDLKAPLKISEAISFVKCHKERLYANFEEAKKWIFSPESENQLIVELGEQLVEYQNFRNGYKAEISSLRSTSEFKELNEEIRINFIRYNHNIRIEKYVKNLTSRFEGVGIENSFAKKMTRDLGKICRSHGEDISYVENLDTNAQYYGDQSANLQFVSVILRIADIIHFSFDRAPIALRSSKVFKSEYSFQQWAIKNNGVNYTIQNGLISYKAYCGSPESYFKLHQYIDWIDGEIQNYFRCERMWNKKYIQNLEDHVNRDGIENDEDVFLPERNLKFRINQRQILELLMGVGLYKDEYACLRELYQNSLDACRSMKALLNSDDLASKFSISFGLDKQDGDVYLYCHDNGIGMDKEIIEKYLLNIGNSYYKSTSFYKKQAEWNGDFTPTSQFGIGILSCFMIGSQIEILTKSYNGNVISCAMNGPHEGFYYKSVTNLDKEKIGKSGTIIRVLLLENIKNELLDHQINKIGLPLLTSSPHLNEEFSCYQKYFEGWDNHLYSKLDSFVCVPFDDIEVNISLDESKQVLPIRKPRIFHHVDNGLNDSDLNIVDFVCSNWSVKINKFNYSDVYKLIETYDIRVEHNGIEFYSSICLPKNNFPHDDLSALSIIRPLKSKGYCIDGISVEGGHRVEEDKGLTALLVNCGVINFTGELRPQISVDRKSVTSWPDKLSTEIENLSKEFVRAILECVNNHINEYDINPNSRESNIIWQHLFAKYSYGDVFFVDELITSNHGDVLWEDLEKVTNNKFSLKEFIKSDNVTLGKLNFFSLNELTKNIIASKLLGAKFIKVDGLSADIKADKFYKLESFLKLNYRQYQEILIYSDAWNGEYSEYDMVSGLLPIIPAKLHSSLIDGEVFEAKKYTDRGVIIQSYSNGIAAFVNQDPLLIHQELGLFYNDRTSFEEEKGNSVYNFCNKRKKFHLSDLNSHKDMFESKELDVFYVFVTPRELTDDENRKLEIYRDKDPEYHKGVKEGWSILLTGRNTYNYIIKAGIQSRTTLVDMLPDEFWSENQEYAFKFLDGEK